MKIGARLLVTYGGAQLNLEYEQRQNADFGVSPLGASANGAGERRCRVQKSGQRSVGLLIRAILVRPPEGREVAAEVQFEVAPNTVTDITDLGTARLRTGPGQDWEE